MWGTVGGGGQGECRGAAGYRKGTQFMLCGVLATERKSGKVGIGLHASDCPHADTLKHGPFALSLPPPLSPPPPPPPLSLRASETRAVNPERDSESLCSSVNSQTCDPTEFPSLSPASLLKALTSAQYVSPSSLRRSCHLMKGRGAKVQQKRPTLHGTEGSRRQGQQDTDFVKKTHRKQQGKGG